MRILFLLFCMLIFSCSAVTFPVAKSGTIDLRGYTFDMSSAVNLDGEWLFYPNNFQEDLKKDSTIIPVLQTIPGSWRKIRKSEGEDLPFGYGTYRLTLLLPATVDSLSISAPNIVNSYRLYVNGTLIGSVGIPGKSAETTSSRISPRLLSFACAETTTIAIDVANYELNSLILGGGICGNVQLGTPELLAQRSEIATFVDILLVGGFLFVSIFLLIFYLVYRHDRSYLYFSIFIGTVMIRFLSCNSKFFFESILNDSVSWAWMQRLELIGFYGAAAAILLYISSFFGNGKSDTRIVRAVVTIDILFCVVVLFTPPQIYMVTLHPFQAFALAHIVYTGVMILRSYLAGKDRFTALLIGSSLMVFYAMTIVDILNASLLPGKFTAYFSAQGLVLFVIIQAWVLASKYMQMFNSVTAAKQVSDRHLKIIEMYTRKTIVDIINRGHNPLALDATSIKTCILFSDIRDFTTFAENLTPMETVATLNNYFSAMSECITRNGGEIDKLIGDCIMALFVDSDSAVNASVEMRMRLRDMNATNEKVALYNGVGINFGEVIIGNIGSESKLDYTVIGDSVNSASRIESLTKYYNLPILISDEIRMELNNSHKIRFVDRVLVKGKKDPISIYEVYDHEPLDIQEMKDRIQNELDKAFILYQDGHFEEALKIYTHLAGQVGPHSYIEGSCADPMIDFCISRCENLLERERNGMLRNWGGVFEFVDK